MNRERGKERLGRFGKTGEDTSVYSSWEGRILLGMLNQTCGSPTEWPVCLSPLLRQRGGDKLISCMDGKKIGEYFEYQVKRWCGRCMGKEPNKGVPKVR